MRFYDKDDRFYEVKCVAIYNMKVKEWIHSDEIECKDNYFDFFTNHQSKQNEQTLVVSTDDENLNASPTGTDTLYSMAEYFFKYKCAAKREMNYMTLVMQSNFKMH